MMHPLRRRKLQLIVLFLALIAVAAGLVLYVLRQNISLFYSPSQIASADIPWHRSIRIGGLVVRHSIQHEPGQLGVHFAVTDYKHTVIVSYQGVLPDLFREGQGIVAQGILQDKTHFLATQVLAKHDENYMPPEVKNSLRQGVS